MKPIIKSITEAFSMQPVTITITDPRKRSIFNPEDDIKEIVSMWNEEQLRVYVGYDFGGQKKFEYHTKSVNVHYL